MKLTNKEKNLLSFIAQTTMGVVSIYDPDTANLAYKLYCKGFLEK